MKHRATNNEPTLAEILNWFDDAELTVTAVVASTCESCVTPAAA